MKTLSIPIEFFYSNYDASKYPGSSKCTNVKDGANCQYFAYELLKYFGHMIPDLRSSNLWEDTQYTYSVDEFEPLDILFFNSNMDSYGAHVGIYLGATMVIHLCKEVGYPTVWNMREFLRREQYSFFIGAKRVKRDSFA